MRASSVVVVIVLLGACTAPPLVATDAPTGDGGEPLPSAGTATLRPGTIILPSHVTANAIVELGSVTFPIDDAVLGLVRGNVIVSGSNDGFIRRVYKVEPLADTVRVITSRATLADAVAHAEFHATFVGDELVIDDAITGGTDVLTTDIRGGLTITPTFELGFAITDNAIDSFELAISGAGVANVWGTVRFASPNHWAWGEENQSEAKTLFRTTYALGPLPIVVVGRMTAALAANAYVEDDVTFTAGAEATLSVDARSTFVPGAGWTTTDASTFDVRQIGPTHEGVGHASLAIGVAPRFELAFYGVAGTKIGVHAQAGGFGTYCNATLITALQAALVGEAAFDLAPITPQPMTYVKLFDDRVSLDAVEQCTQE